MTFNIKNLILLGGEGKKYRQYMYLNSTGDDITTTNFFENAGLQVGTQIVELSGANFSERENYYVSAKDKTSNTVTASTETGVSAEASKLTGTTLASNVVSSSLTSLGTLTGLNVSGASTLGGALSVDGELDTGEITVQADATPKAMFIYGRASDDSAQFQWYENDKTTQLFKIDPTPTAINLQCWQDLVIQDSSTSSLLRIDKDTGSATFSGAVKVGAYTLPATDGTNGQVLVTNGSGVLTWTTL